MKALLGVDIGTQGVKAALFAEDGTRLASAFRPSRLHKSCGGVVEEDPEFQLKNVCSTMRDCVRKAKIASARIAAVAVDGQMAGVIGVGADGRHVTPYDSWLDTRCTPYIEEMNRVAGDEIIAKTGGPASFNHGPKQLWWMHERRQEFKRVRSFVQPGGYAAMRLCGLDGNAAFLDTTYLHFTGFADSVRRRWDRELCNRFRFDEAKLPRIVNPHEIIGEVIPSMARRCGLRGGTPVVAGCGDTAASFLACGATRVGLCVDVAGTASVFAATTDSFRADRRNRILSCGRAATPGLWHPYAYVNGGGMNLEWFRTELPAVLGRSTSRGTTSLAALDRAAAKLAPDETLPLFVPHLGGRVSPSQPALRGAWVGLTWAHTAAHLWRAVLEGVAMEYALYRQALIALYSQLPVRELRVTGGGSQSALWNQIKADVLGAPVFRIVQSDGAPTGAAMLAAFGVNLIKNLDAATRRWIKKQQAARPSRSLTSYYARRLRRYESLLEVLNDWSVT